MIAELFFWRMHRRRDNGSIMQITMSPSLSWITIQHLLARKSPNIVSAAWTEDSQGKSIDIGEFLKTPFFCHFTKKYNDLLL
jgi:hypothetical protein